MAMKHVFLVVAYLGSFLQAQTSCSSSLVPTNSVQPSVASGYSAQLVATGLSKPRSIEFDTAGNLLVVEAGSGSLSGLTFREDGTGCLSLSGKTKVLENQQLNHGIALSSNGSVLFASSSEAAYSWDYDSSTMSATNNRTLVTGMNTNDHTTRTLLLSREVPSMLLISRGSTSNVDLEAADITSGHSQIKAFNLNNLTSGSYDYNTDGLRLGWGLRNSVGVAEHPTTGGIWSVENSVDQMMRDGEDIHEDNPGEEMNFHGFLNGTFYAQQGQNYGYPWCFAAWNVSAIPNHSNLTVGKQFAIDPTDGQSRNDSYCAAQVPPQLTFQAHMAPLDIKFNNSGSEVWVTFHGSWDRTDPVGYKLSLIEFDEDNPVPKATSLTAATDIFANIDNSVCPDQCFRPVGIAFDKAGRLFLSSDATGEIYMVVKNKSSKGTLPTSGSGSPASGTSSGTRSSSTSDAVSLALSRPVITTLTVIMAFTVTL